MYLVFTSVIHVSKFIHINVKHSEEKKAILINNRYTFDDSCLVWRWQKEKKRKKEQTDRCIQFTLCIEIV